MKRKQTTPLTLAAAVAASLAGTPATADSPFTAQPLAGGYMLAAADKAAEGKCGEGKCGAAMGMGDAKKAEPGKTSTEKAAPKAKPKAKPKAAEAKCGEGKCGEGMCGGKAKTAPAKADEGKCGGRK